MPAQITCPHCDKVLKSAAAIPAGRKVKCPGCGEPFVTQEDAPETTAIKAAGRNGSATNGKHAPVEDDRPRSRRVADEDDRPPRRTRDDDDEPADDDDRPVRGKKAKKKKGSKAILVVALLVGVGLLVGLTCVGGGIGVFFWMRSGGGGANDPMTFVMPEKNVIAGLNLNRLRDNGQLETLVQGMENPNQLNNGPFGGGPGGMPIGRGNPFQQKNGMPKVLTELIRDGDSLVITASTDDIVNNTDQALIAIRTRKPIDVEKVKAGLGAGGEQKIGGHKVYRVNIDNKPGFMAFPGDKLVILASLAEAEFTRTLTTGKKAHPAQELITPVQGKDVWAVIFFDAGLKQKMQQNLNVPAGGPGQPGNIGMAMFAEQIKGLSQAIQNGKGASVSYEMTGGANAVHKTKLSLLCANDGDADKAKTSSEQIWTNAKNLVALMGAAGGPKGGNQGQQINNIVNDVDKGLKFTKQGAFANIEFDLSEQTRLQFVQMANNAANPFGPGPVGPGPGPIGPPPFPKKF